MNTLLSESPSSELSFADRADQLCNRLRALEHQMDDPDELFYCAYLLGLLGVYGGMDGTGAEDFDQLFHQGLIDTLVKEKVSDADQKNILELLSSVK